MSSESSKKKPFPVIKRTIESLIEDEEGNIPAGRLVTTGAIVLLLTLALAGDAFAGHSSHRSHTSHRSHSSHSSHSSGSGAHSSHASHQSHSSHVSGDDGASHSSGGYSEVEHSSGPRLPSPGSIPGVQRPSADTPNGLISPAEIESLKAQLAVPQVQSPIPTPAVSVPVIEVPELQETVQPTDVSGYGISNGDE